MNVYLFVEVDQALQIRFGRSCCGRTLPRWSHGSGQEEPIAARRKQLPIGSTLAAVEICLF